MTNNDTFSKLTIGQPVTVEGYYNGVIVALQPAADSISGKDEVRVELQPYGNRAWFAATVVTALAERTAAGLPIVDPGLRLGSHMDPKPANGIAGMAWTD